MADIKTEKFITSQGPDCQYKILKYVLDSIGLVH